MRNFENLAEYTTDMQPKWNNLYEELNSYVEQHSDIDIKENVINISRDKQSKFYKLFDRVRDTYIAGEFSELLKEANLFSNAYLKTEQEFIDALAINDIFMPNDVKRFLHKPLNQLRREIFDPLFDLLSGKVDMDRFISETSLKVNLSFKQLYKEGYEKWTVLSLLKQFEPDKLYHVPLNKLGSKQVIKHSVLAKESLPIPVESKNLAFEVGRRQSLLVPDAIIHSARLDKYVSFRTNFTRAMWNANSYSPRREWYSIHSLIDEFGSITIRPDFLVYIDDKLEDVSLVADNDRICRPDLVIGCIYGQNADEALVKDKIADISSCNQVLKPTNGSYIISRQDISHYVPDNLKAKINLIKVDFDGEKLGSIVNAIKIQKH